MKKSKRIISFLASSLMLLPSLVSLSSCGSNSDDGEKQVLRIYNAEDYISNEDDEEYGYIDLISAFEDKYNVSIEYSTFGTLENMYNELQINPGSYDLICPSEYMVMKMMKEDMLEPFTDDFFDESNEENYYINNVSDYIRDMFDANGWNKYAACYMWGTMGFMYAPEHVSEEDISAWTSLSNEAFSNKFTLKDSVRDTYFLAVAYVNHDKLMQLKSDRDEGKITSDEYHEQISAIMNSTDEETVKKVQSTLRELKKNAYGFEVDSGKNDMVTGKLWINFCWSGDAAYAIYESSEENDMTLYYSVPEEVTNIWFDGWVMPKGANVDLAQKFINFVSMPENAIANMNYIGYTSAIANDDVLEYVKDSYALSEEDIDEDSVLYDLSYFFGEGDAAFYVSADDAKGMLFAQYPTTEIVDRAVTMQYFDDEANARINMMWEDVKGAEIPLSAVIFILIIAAVLVFAFVVTKYSDRFVIHFHKKGFRKIEK